MNLVSLIAVSAATAIAASFQASLPPGTSPAGMRLSGGGSIVRADGAVIGQANVYRGGEGFRDYLFQVAVRGLAPGVHGVSVHKTGQCKGPRFRSAGAIWDRSGSRGSRGRSGVLGDIAVGASGAGRLEVLVREPAIYTSGPQLLDFDGSAIVIRDQSVRSGLSDGIACGVLKPNR